MKSKIFSRESIRLVGAYGFVFIMNFTSALLAILSPDQYYIFSVIFYLFWPTLPFLLPAITCYFCPNLQEIFLSYILIILISYGFYFFLMLVQWERIIDGYSARKELNLKLLFYPIFIPELFFLLFIIFPFILLPSL